MVKNKVSSDDVAEILADAEIVVDKLFDNCTMVACRLDNGFIIVETSACVDPANYDEEIGYNICMERIVDKIYELEGYKLCEQRAEYDRYEGEEENEDDKDEMPDCENCPDLHKCLEDYDKYDEDYGRGDVSWSYWDDIDDIIDSMADYFDRIDDFEKRYYRRYRG